MKLFLVVALALLAVVHAGKVQVVDINPDKVQVVDLPKDSIPVANDKPSYETPSIKPEYVEPQPCDVNNPKCYQRPSIDPEYVQDNNEFPSNLYRIG